MHLEVLDKKIKLSKILNIESLQKDYKCMWAKTLQPARPVFYPFLHPAGPGNSLAWPGLALIKRQDDCSQSYKTRKSYIITQ